MNGMIKFNYLCINKKVRLSYSFSYMYFRPSYTKYGENEMGEDLVKSITQFLL